MTTTTTLTMDDADKLLKSGLSMYATAKKLNIAVSSLRLRILSGRREFKCKECGAVVPIPFGSYKRYFCSRKCSTRYYSRKSARECYAKKHGGKREFVCKFCGGKFETEIGDKRRGYCSESCRYHAHLAYMQARRQTKEKAPEKFYCLMCGEEIVRDFGDKRRKYCTPLCMKFYTLYRVAKNKKRVYQKFLAAKEKQNLGNE